MIPSFEKRVRAFAIDTSAVTLFVILSMPLNNMFPTESEFPLIPYLVSGLAFFGFYLFPYFISKGQTFGKRVQKIKVVDVTGVDAPLWRILMRDVFKLSLSIVTFGLYMVVSFFVMSDQTSRTIHDYIFKTKVIDLEKPTGKNNFMAKSESMRKRGF